MRHWNKAFWLAKACHIWRNIQSVFYVSMAKLCCTKLVTYLGTSKKIVFLAYLRITKISLRHWLRFQTVSSVTSKKSPNFYLLKLPKNDQLEKWNILTSSQKLTENVGNFGKIIGATGFEKLPKVQFITQNGHTGTSSSLQPEWPDCCIIFFNIWPFRTRKLCQKHQIFAKVASQFFLIRRQWPKNYKILPNLRNFAKSVHAVCNECVFIRLGVERHKVVALSCV